MTPLYLWPPKLIGNNEIVFAGTLGAELWWPCGELELELPVVKGRNAEPAFLASKMERIREPHVAELNELADRIAVHSGLEPGVVPYVDPDAGGVGARMLVLLDNPSSQAEAGTGSGLLSVDNNDWTARNCREAYERHGIRWSDVVHWNVVPFPVVNSNGSSTAGE